MDDSISNFNSRTSQEQSCRICRYRRLEELIECPCQCTGSVGLVHLTCLKRWIYFRRSNQCEICKAMYDIQFEPRNYWKLFLNFFQMKYFGAIVKHSLNIVAVTPLILFSTYQIMRYMESTNIGQQNTIKLLMVEPAKLFINSVLFFLYSEWSMFSLTSIQRIINLWWNFGDQDDDIDIRSFDHIEHFAIILD